MHKNLNNKSAILVFVIPFILLYTFMMIYPIVQTFFKSFYQWDGINIPRFIGIENYRGLLSDPNFIPAIKNGIRTAQKLR